MSRYAFFRQTGWMVAAAVGAGAFTFLVTPILTKDLLPFLHKKFIEEEYGLFAALLGLVSWLSTPANGLQSSIAQQTISALSPEAERQLRGTVRRLLLVLLGIWLLVLAAVLLLQKQLMTKFTIYHPASLWITMLIGLPVLWQPVFSGILQGKQNFLWLGWRSILDAAVRCTAVFVFVRAMGVHVTGAMAGVFLGSCTSLAIAFWQAWPTLRGPADPVEWGAWLRRALPLTLGLAASAFMLAADTVIVRRYFPPEQTGLYGAVALIGRALMYLIVPVTQVMFPKVVQAAARSESTDAMTHALAVTGLVGAAGALACTLFPELPFRILLSPAYLPAKALLWIYAWCMVPATLTTVLINNLMARQHFQSVPWLVGSAIAYGVTLAIVAHRVQGLPALPGFRAIVLTLGVFSVLMLAITIWFTIRRR